MKRRRYVILEGGFGNQLWQLAFAHKLVSYGKVTLIKIVHESEKQHSEIRTLDIEKVIENCGHEIELRKLTFERIFTRARFLTESNFNIYKDSIIDFRLSSWKDMLGVDLSKARKYIGYFQSLHLLQAQVEVVVNELIETSNQHKPQIDLKGHNSNISIHMRGGDYFNPKHKDLFGVLSSQYYLKLFEIISEQHSEIATVITNDPRYAKEILVNKPEIKILGPESIDAWESFILMMNSKVACTANSSFSWWSGMVVKKLGGRMIVPFPWNKNELNSVGEYPDIYDAGMEKLSSSFL